MERVRFIQFKSTFSDCNLYKKENNSEKPESIDYIKIHYDQFYDPMQKPKNKEGAFQTKKLAFVVGINEYNNERLETAEPGLMMA